MSTVQSWDQRAQRTQKGEHKGLAVRWHNAVLVMDSSPIDEEAADEGLMTLVQAGTCRCMILAKSTTMQCKVCTVMAEYEKQLTG